MTEAAMASHRTGEIRTFGAVCFAAGLLGAGLSGYLASVSWAVGADPFGYPQALPEHTALQMLLALSRVGLIFGLLALWWSGAVPRSRRTQVGLDVARGGEWQGWRSWVPAILGLWLFVPVLPTLVRSHEAAGWAVSAWLLLFALLGLALMRWGGMVRHRPPAERSGTSART